MDQPETDVRKRARHRADRGRRRRHVRDRSDERPVPVGAAVPL
jgi:hypothetical protein